jgi:hypothetical protein
MSSDPVANPRSHGQQKDRKIKAPQPRLRKDPEVVV